MLMTSENEMFLQQQKAMRKEAADFLKGRLPSIPQLVVELGTGQNGFAQHIQQEAVIPYTEIPHFKPSTAPFHVGNLVYGKLEGKPILVMQGRLHLYEGYTFQEITFPIRALHEAGVSILVACNGGGSVNPLYQVGDLMLIQDHINLLWGNPLAVANDPELGPRFPDMTDAYSPRLRAIARRIAANEGIRLWEGVYVANIGPTYETPAETMMAYRLGGDLVGMSTVPEVIVARHMGMEVLGISQVGNRAAGLQQGEIVHSKHDPNTHVLEGLDRLLRMVVAEIA
jgi:purine-nucleoside phosphorylase